MKLNFWVTVIVTLFYDLFPRKRYLFISRCFFIFISFIWEKPIKQIQECKNSLINHSMNSDRCKRGVKHGRAAPPHPSRFQCRLHCLQRAQSQPKTINSKNINKKGCCRMAYKWLQNSFSMTAGSSSCGFLVHIYITVLPIDHHCKERKHGQLKSVLYSVIIWDISFNICNVN